MAASHSRDLREVSDADTTLQREILQPILRIQFEAARCSAVECPR